MNRLGLLAVGVLGFCAFAGCRDIAGPCWLHPGSAQTQQSRALRYDPYPETATGPAIVGVRPREYDKPPAEPTRARWKLDSCVR